MPKFIYTDKNSPSLPRVLTGCSNRQNYITCLPNSYQFLKAIQQTKFVTTNTALILMAYNPHLKSAHQADIVTIVL